LKDKIGEYSKDLTATPKDYSNYETVVSALVSLGYKAGQAKDAIEMVMDENRGKTLSIEEMIKLSLKKLNS
jgi:Holliday junction resolvasome RuvABC DNA-binding subunit